MNRLFLRHIIIQLSTITFVMTSGLWAQVTLPRVENPHLGGDNCLVCHRGEGEPSTKNLIPNACAKCHSTKSINQQIHILSPVNLDSKKRGVSIPKLFPLESNDSLRCSTCHQASCKPQRSNSSYLRGAPYASELDFCYACHNEKSFVRVNPHQQINKSGKIIESTCLNCHKVVPDIHKEETEMLQMSIVETCNKCHAMPNHEVNHMGKAINNFKNIKMVFETQAKKTGISLPLTDEKTLSCTSCHNVHNRNVLIKADDTKHQPKVNQHFLQLPKAQLCKACHGY